MTPLTATWVALMLLMCNGQVPPPGSGSAGHTQQPLGFGAPHHGGGPPTIQPNIGALTTPNSDTGTTTPSNNNGGTPTPNVCATPTLNGGGAFTPIPPKGSNDGMHPETAAAALPSGSSSSRLKPLMEKLCLFVMVANGLIWCEMLDNLLWRDLLQDTTDDCQYLNTMSLLRDT